MWQKRETAKKWERVPVQMYDSSVGLVHRALQWPSKCCWNENHISAADFLPHVTAPLPAPALLSQTPSSLPEGLCRSGLATVWFSLVNYNLWSWTLFWNTLLSYFCSFFFSLRSRLTLLGTTFLSVFFLSEFHCISKLNQWLITVCYELSVPVYILAVTMTTFCQTANLYLMCF